MSSFSNGSGSLRPTWSRSSGSQGGRGFQPPPAVPAERRTRSGSQGSSGSGGGERPAVSNKFAALDDDEDIVPSVENLPSPNKGAKGPPFRANSFGNNKSPTGPKGRSLADLAATVPDSSIGRSNSMGYKAARSDSFSAENVKVIRYTREKILALRPQPSSDAEPPDCLRHLEGNPILSATPLDPVCWDTFDAEEIWAQAARERSARAASTVVPKGGGVLKTLADSADQGRRSSAAPGFGRWERGVALPPPGEGGSTRKGSRGDAENPDDLWDDPLSATDAAADFSAFGAIPDDPKDIGNEGDAFDFNKMAEATQKFEDSLRGNSKSSLEGEVDNNGDRIHSVTVDPHRPLASAGTTIRSGSGDDVNVFEDFDDDLGPEDEPASEPAVVKSINQDPNASSRLMKMIGVNREETTNLAETASKEKETEEDPKPTAPVLNPWATASSAGSEASNPPALGGIEAAIPSNPWGEPIIPSAVPQPVGGGFDLAARLEQEQKAREELQLRHSLQEAEIIRRRQEEEESKRRAMEERARQQAMQQRQQTGHSQVELVLVERISVFLENSWGRSDLMSILTTLHSEDSRVIPLLGNVDALRALIARHPRRIALRQDPAFGAEMAVLLLTNSQFQQQQQQQAQARVQQEEIQRREQQLRMEEMRSNHNGELRIIPDAPWFYSDPQNNIQGPFRGEEMRQWLEAGYFKGDLPISQKPNGPFHQLSALFPDLSVAFRAPGSSDSDEAATRENEERTRIENERRVAEERAEAEAAAAQREREMRAAVEAQKRSVSYQNDQQNASSAQLKMMLGLGAGQQIDITNDEPSLVDETPGDHPQARPQGQRSNSAPMPAASASPKPAWGSTAVQAPRKSMSQIQQEEARAAALLAMERQATGRSSSGGWANIAASRGGISGWSSGAVKQTSPAVVTGSNALTNARMVQPTRQSQSKPGAAQHQQSAPSAMQPTGTSQETSNPAEDFGASMSPMLESWCKDQMRKLNGSDDLTLVSFCMTLNDPNEIRQYLTAYLGSTPQVNNFASEFINKRGLGANPQEEWESTKSKKGKKKGGK